MASAACAKRERKGQRVKRIPFGDLGLRSDSASTTVERDADCTEDCAMGCLCVGRLRYPLIRVFVDSKDCALIIAVVSSNILAYLYHCSLLRRGHSQELAYLVGLENAKISTSSPPLGLGYAMQSCTSNALQTCTTCDNLPTRLLNTTKQLLVIAPLQICRPRLL